MVYKIVAGVVGGALALGVGFGGVLADVGPFPNPGYEIEAKTLYCQDRSSTCGGPKVDQSKLRFADVDLYNYTPLSPADAKNGNADSVPELVHATCAMHDAAGTPTTVSDFTVVTRPDLTTLAGAQGTLDLGTVGGHLSLRHGTESSTNAVADVYLTAYDQINKSFAIIAGTQSTNNVTDTYVRGNFHVVIGTLTAHRYQVQTCETGKNPLTVPGVTDFENSATDSDNPNS